MKEKILNYQEIINKFGGMWGIYKIDLYHTDEKTKAESFVKATHDFKEAIEFAVKNNYHIHTIPLHYINENRKNNL